MTVMRTSRNDFASAVINRFRKNSLALACVAFGVLSFQQIPSAKADFRACNKTESTVNIAIGYRDGADWITEGWWTIDKNTCDTLVSGDLASRYYYLYAVQTDQNGEWDGKAYMCVRQKKFTIRGIEDCVARGYERTGFFEIDTGEQSSWTVQLTEPVEQGTGGR
ncbi:hypothetical protein PsW64_00878 [Pseudovibrio sp. W64]|uniref:Uncharacterized membrane protein n=2 Tax=Pseudovibrio TaxID=258255 RepID=A0A1I4AI74_9HYPH|nr:MULTISPECIES: DUF1036 domain-containing protein [Pseudovibrio]KZK79859.1 hypothetical protein PsAD13_04847 [Pseudovibrio sp. Ad13]KZK88315.1 hypothetical protein PsW64_00878 [Pseudovibrio sp. W64]KZL01403.1 hypothetical protein PsAD5_00636 [Pseudovibrio sp. Ad5]KZL04100.1 hypothetical protein PsW74_00135 [Pseudovibrio sp. W74]KZK76538.1 hypothetical protein PsAD46_05295 [Pseudovibrio sp. Ad46]